MGHKEKEAMINTSMHSHFNYGCLTVDSRFNQPRGEMKNSSLYQEFAISKNSKIVFFSQILNSRLDLHLKRNKRGEDDEILRFE